MSRRLGRTWALPTWPVVPPRLAPTPGPSAARQVPSGLAPEAGIDEPVTAHGLRVEAREALSRSDRRGGRDAAQAPTGHATRSTPGLLSFPLDAPRVPPRSPLRPPTTGPHPRPLLHLPRHVLRQVPSPLPRLPQGLGLQGPVP